MGITSNRNSSSDKVRKELQSLNSKLSTSMSYLQVEEEINFLGKVPLGIINKYDAREKHFDKVLKLWFKGILLEHELLVSKGTVKPYGKDATVKAFLKFADVLRVYLVELGILKNKKTSGGLKVTLENLYQSTFKTTNSESSDHDEEKKKKLFKNEKELEELLNDNNNLDNNKFEKNKKEKESKERSESLESSEKEVVADSKESVSDHNLAENKAENINKKEKAFLGVDPTVSTLNSQDMGSGVGDEFTPDIKEANNNIYGKNAYYMMQNQINNMETARMGLEMEREKLESLKNGNKDFFKELQDFRRENDKRFLDGKESEKEPKDKNLSQAEKDRLKNLNKDLKDKESKEKDKKDLGKEHLNKKQDPKKDAQPINKGPEKVQGKPSPIKERFDKFRDKVKETFNPSSKQKENSSFMSDYEKNKAEAIKALNKSENGGIDMNEYERNKQAAMDAINKNQIYSGNENQEYEMNKKKAIEALKIDVDEVSIDERNQYQDTNLMYNHEDKEINPIEREPLVRK